jgi:colicin import membrane protein
MKAEAGGEPEALRKRRSPGRWRAIVLAILVHAAFFALIIFGIRWQSMPTAPVSADLWSKLPATKKSEAPPAPKPQPPAPKPEPPKPEPAPPPKPQYAPMPKPEPTPPAPPQEQAKFGPQAPDPAEIAAQREREKKAQEEAAAKKKAQEEAAAKKKAQEEAAAKKKAQEEAAKKKAQEEAARKKREEEKRLAEERAKAEEAERERQAAATARQMEIQSWVDKIKAKILNRAIVPDTVATGTEVTVHIRILPGGDVLDINVTRSTNPTYSAAIERAIRSAQPLPVPPANSDLFPQFRDLNLNFRHER